MQTLEACSERQNRPHDDVALAFRCRLYPLILGKGLSEVTNGCPLRPLGLILLLKEDCTDSVLACGAVGHVGTTNVGQGKYWRLNQAAHHCVESVLLILCLRDRVVQVGKSVLFNMSDKGKAIFAM